MCYERRRAEACVDESAHHALVNAGGREIVGQEEGEQKGSARGSVHWGCYYATALDIELCCGIPENPCYTAGTSIMRRGFRPRRRVESQATLWDLCRSSPDPGGNGRTC